MKELIENQATFFQIWKFLNGVLNRQMHVYLKVEEEEYHVFSLFIYILRFTM